MDIAGMTLAVQDVVSIAGQPLWGGLKMLEGYVAPFDATVVARLRRAGAVVVRGGALPAVGVDSGGETRRSAAAGGCVGLRPSYGRVSRYGVAAYVSSMDAAGPLAGTVEEAATLLRVMAGHDPLDGMTADVPVPDYCAALRGGFKGLRVGVPREYFAKGADDVRQAIEGCARAGAEVVEVSLPHTGYAAAAYCVIAAAEASTNLARFDGVRYGHRTKEQVGSVADLFAKSRGEGFGDKVKRDIILGTYLLSKACYEKYFVQAQKVRTLIRRDFEEAFKVCDVMMMPVSAGGMGNEELGIGNLEEGEFTAPASLAGICALAMPCGAGGLQVLGPAFGEGNVLRAAYAYEQEVRA
ncbi:MAG: amidase family protein [Kiritimatiellaeota bacterium]|nr:amidase family protein [Kiritimatiellota bacterium]